MGFGHQGSKDVALEDVILRRSRLWPSTSSWILITIFRSTLNAEERVSALPPLCQMQNYN